MSDRELFLLLIDEPDEAARRRLRDERCAGDAVRGERIDRLLAAHVRAGGFLEGSLEDVAPTLLQAPETPAAGSCHAGPGSVLAGRYVLVRPIGRGGMGVVWIAEQNEPVARLVAVKLIRPDLDSASTFARFATERQTLAMMDHPNIAKVFDGGTTEDGRPFVVMELVEGVPITRYCDDECLNLEERLGLFITVCRAIHHAHQKGIIHRDLKPTNVLIARCDGQPVPKIIDFGVAKTTHGRLDALGTCTGHGDVIGTPQYWSPEQAGLNPHDIDTRSDIYGLGLLLYELLAGRQPFSVETGGAVGIIELVRAIRECDPPPPSASAPDADTAAARRTVPDKLARSLRGDLDWIAMKCLEKDRNRRYESADGLAADLGRFLADEPVAAGPPSTTYRLRKFARKHRKSLVAAGAVGLVLVCGTIGTTVGMLRAARAEAVARDHELAARGRFILAQEAVNDYLTTIAEDAELRRADHHDLRLRLLASAIPFYQKLAAERPNDPEQMLAQAVAYLRHAELAKEVGEANTVLASLERAEQILRDIPGPADSGEVQLVTARVKRRLADHAADRGDSRAARIDYRAALAILERLAADDPEARTTALDLARTYNNYGLFLGQNRDSTAGDHFRRAVQILADFSGHFGRSNDLIELQSVCLNNLGLDLIEQGRHRDAGVQLELALELTGRLLANDPNSPSLVQKRAGLQTNLARVREAEGDLAAARKVVEAAAEALKSLAERFPRHAEYRVQWAGVENNAAMLQARAGDPRGALVRHDRVIAGFAGFPPQQQNGLYSDFLSNAHAGRAAALDKLKRHAEAAEACRESVERASKELKPLRESAYAIQLARTGRVEPARELMAKLEDNESKLVIYNIACAGAVLYQLRGSPADGDRAVLLLKSAVQRGYSQRELIEGDPDLDGLRERPDYRTLIGGISPGANGSISTDIKS